MDVAVMLRIDRFTSTFFTVVKAAEVLPAAAGHFTGYPDTGPQLRTGPRRRPGPPFARSCRCARALKPPRPNRSRGWPRLLCTRRILRPSTRRCCRSSPGGQPPPQVAVGASNEAPGRSRHAHDRVALRFSRYRPDRFPALAFPRSGRRLLCAERRSRLDRKPPGGRHECCLTRRVQ
jgi:hypothetical protein